MGVLNLTQDSFSDGGELFTGDALDMRLVLQRAKQHIQEGASILDIGAESTRPGADSVSVADELARVVLVVDMLARECDVVISVDTSQPEVMRSALDAGAHIINDVRALRLPGALEVVAQADCGVCLMHMQGEPGCMQKDPHYEDVVAEVRGFFTERVQVCYQAGITRERLLLDPGFGFGKTLAHNVSLLKRLRAVTVENLPLAVGVSRKTMLGALTNRDVGQRVVAGAVAAAYAVEQGAAVVRTHDVAATRDALSVMQAIV